MTNKNKNTPILNHYKSQNLGDRILSTLTEMGKDIENLSIKDLAPVDQFHIRGMKATKELLKMVDIKPEFKILDIGSALGGTARFLANETGCEITGLELVSEYYKVAEMLSSKLGFDNNKTTFKQGSATNLPFADNSFEIVWTEHVQMNVDDKVKFYSEIKRVLKPGGQLVFHDVFSGENIESKLDFPVPWASDNSINYLVSIKELQKILSSLNFSTIQWEEKTEISRDFFRKIVKSMKSNKIQLPFGMHLVMGESTNMKFYNLLSNIENDRICIIQAVIRNS